MLFVTTGSQRKMLQSHSHPQTFTHTYTLTIYFFSLSHLIYKYILTRWQK